MSTSMLPERLRVLLDHYTSSDRSIALALHSFVDIASEDGSTTLHELAIRYRDDYLAALPQE